MADIFDQISPDQQQKGSQGDIFDQLSPAATPASTTPETDSALKEIMAFARKPSPEWLQPFERFVTQQQLVPKQLMPAYWMGKEAQWASQFLPGPLRKAGEIYGGAVTGIGEAGSAFTTPANLGLAATTGGVGRVGQLLISGVFLGQAIKGTPEQWRALQAAPTLAEKANIATQMGVSYLPAVGIAESALHFKGEPAAPVPTTPARPWQQFPMPPGGPIQAAEAMPPPPVPAYPFQETGEVGAPVEQRPAVTAPKEEGVTDATRIESTGTLPELEVRTSMGAKTPLWGQPEGVAGAQAPQEPVPAAVGAVAPEAAPPEAAPGVSPFSIEKHGNAYAIVDNRKPGKWIYEPTLAAAEAREQELNLEIGIPLAPTPPQEEEKRIPGQIIQIGGQTHRVTALQDPQGRPMLEPIDEHGHAMGPVVPEAPPAARPAEPEPAPEDSRAADLAGQIAEFRNRNPDAPVPKPMRDEMEQLEQKITAKMPPPREPTKLNPDEQEYLKRLEGQISSMQNKVGNYYVEGQPRLKDMSKEQRQEAVNSMEQLWQTWDKIHEYWEKSGQPYDMIGIGTGAVNLKLGGHSPYEGRRILLLEASGRTGGAAKESLELFNVGGGVAGITGREYFDKKYFTARVAGADIRVNSPVIDVKDQPDGTVKVTVGHTDAKGNKVVDKVYNGNRALIGTGAGTKTSVRGEPFYKGQELTGFGNAERLARNARGGVGLIYGAANSSTQGIIGALRPGGAKHIIVVSRHKFGPEASENQDKRVLDHRAANRADIVIGSIKSVTKNPDGTFKVEVRKSADNPKANYDFDVNWVENFLGGDIKKTGAWIPAGIKKTPEGLIWVRDASLKTSMPGVYAGGDIRMALPGEGKGSRIDLAEGDAARTAVLLQHEIGIKRATGKLPPWEASPIQIQNSDQQLKILQGMKPMEEERGPPGAGGMIGSLPTRTEGVSPQTRPSSGESFRPRTPAGEGGREPLPGTSLPAQDLRPSTSTSITGDRPATPEVTEQNLRENMLLEKQKDTPRTLTPSEDAALEVRENELQRRYDAVASDTIDAQSEGDSERIAENDVKVSELLDKLQDVRTARKTGKPPPDMKLAGDFSLENMTKQKMAVNKGVALTPAENEQVRQAYQKIKDKEDAAQAYLATPQARSYWEELSKRAEAYRTGKGPLKPLKFDPAYIAKLGDTERTKQEWFDHLEADRRARLTWWQKTPDFLLKWRRSFVISGLHSIAKLATAAVEGSLILPAREGAGALLSHLPLISKVAKVAPREGGFNIRAEAAAQAEMWKNLISDFGKNLRGQKPDYEVVFGSYRNLPPELQNYVGYLHGALKSPLARNEFARSLEKRTEFAARHGADITDPLVQMELGRQAVEDSQFWRFQNKNIASNAYRRLVTSLERQGAFGKAGATALQAELPVVTVPTNILARTFEGVFGTVPGLYELGKAYRNGIETLKPAEADLIMRHLKTGSFGLALTAIGFFAPQMFGGFYRPGTKKTPEDPGWGETKIPEFVPLLGGKKIPPYLQDNPFLILPQFGATMRQVMDSHLRKRDRDPAGWYWGMWSAIMGAATSQPFVRESLDIAGVADPRRAPNILGEHARSYLIPQVVQQIASMTDPAEKRYPHGLREELMMGLPGLREKIPSTQPYPQQLGLRRRGIIPSKHLRARVSR